MNIPPVNETLENGAKSVPFSHSLGTPADLLAPAGLHRSPGEVTVVYMTVNDINHNKHLQRHQANLILAVTDDIAH